MEQLEELTVDNGQLTVNNRPLMSAYIYPGLGVRNVKRWENIIDSVCKFYGLDSMVGNTKKYPLIEARMVAMYLIRCNTKFSFREIGMMFHPMKDHATVLYAVKTVTNWLKHDKNFRNKMRGYLC